MGGKVAEIVWKINENSFVDILSKDELQSVFLKWRKTMAELLRQDQKLIVQDLTKFFNDVAGLEFQKQNQPGYVWKKESLYDITEKVIADFLNFVDFHAETKLRHFVNTTNRLNSVELSAIHYMHFLELFPQAVPVVYDAMRDIAKTNKIPFTPAYTPGK